MHSPRIHSRPSFQPRYENFIGGRWVPPVQGQYFVNYSPIDGSPIAEVPRSTAEDVEMALDAAHAAFPEWSRTSAAARSSLLLKLAEITEQHLPFLAAVETVDNGKPIRETLNADLPLVVDHFRYFAGVIRAEEGTAVEIDADTLSLNIKEPIGVVGQIIPWNFPLLMAAWKIAPALAAGCCTVVKPAEQTPTSILVWLELIQEVLPPGVLNVVNGFGPEAGKALASSPRVNKIAFTGETSTGQLILQYTAANLVPATMELGGKSPNIYFESVMEQDDEFLDKCLEGAVLFALNQGEVCTCPSRVIVQASIAEEFIERFIARTRQIRAGDPLDESTMIGAQASAEQLEKILSYFEVARSEGAEVLTGGCRAQGSGLGNGFFIEPTILRGHNKMRVFQEEIFGPVTALTTFKDEAEAIALANETVYGLGAGVWTRDAHEAYRVPRAIQAGRVWVNCYHAYPAHAPFGGYKKSGFGRETHLMMLNHYRQNKNILTSFSKKKLGFF